MLCIFNRDDKFYRDLRKAASRRRWLRRILRRADSRT